MKHIKHFEDITKVNNEGLPIDKSGKFHFKKPAYKMSYNQSRPTEEGVFFGKNKKWQVVVKDVNNGRLKMISQHLFQNEAQQAYDDYYKNNKKEEKPDKIYKPDKNTNSLIGGTIKTDFKNVINIPHENDWVIIEFNPNYKLSKGDQKFIDFINNTIGRIKIQKDANTYIVEYKTVPKSIEGYFTYNSRTLTFTRTFSDKDIKHYSYLQKYLKKYLIPNINTIKDKNDDVKNNINDKYPYTMGKLFNTFLNFISNLNDILPYKENTYYTVKFNGLYISITNVTKNKVKKTVGLIAIDKEDIFYTKSKFGKNINEKFFKIRFVIHDETDPYVNTIMNYMLNIINDNNNDKIITKKTENGVDEIIFHENEYDDIMSNISKLSLDELKMKIQNE